MSGPDVVVGVGRGCRRSIARLRKANAALREVINTQAVQIETLTGQVKALSAQLAAQVARIEELERRLGSDSSNSSKPPSSDPPYRKPERSSSRTSSGRRPGKQPGDRRDDDGAGRQPGRDGRTATSTAARDCGSRPGRGAGGRVERRQVTDIAPPPPPRVTEYRILTRTCPCCAAPAVRDRPGGGGRRAPSTGPGCSPRAAELTCAHYLPVGRAAALLATLAGIQVSVGFVAGVRGRAARLLEQAFLPRVRELLRTVGVLHADETPARADGGLELRAHRRHRVADRHAHRRPLEDRHRQRRRPARLHRRDRARRLRRLHPPHRRPCTPGAQPTCCAIWPRSTAPTPTSRCGRRRWPTCSSTPTTTPRPPAPPAPTRIDAQTLTDLRRRYLGAYTAGIRDNDNRAGPLARDAATLARRFRDHQDMILRFVVDLAVPFTNNQAERDLRPVKIQQRTSGGTWRTLAGLADFAVVQSYLSTARKWGIDSIDALTRLFTTGAWLPPAAAPC